MTISKTGFFTDNEVLFMGVSSDPKSFSRSVYRDFLQSNITVYPVNKKSFNINEQEVFKSISELSKMPSCAYILMNKENTRGAFNDIKDNGIKKILFHSRSHIDYITISECRERDIEIVIACPKMLIGKAPIHKLHGILAGVRK